MDIDKIGEKERYDMLAEMADLYYNQGKTQSEIAKYFDTNRFRVAKLLQDARNEQIVEIHINYSNERNTVLEAEVKEKLGLDKVIVVNSQYATYTDSLTQMGKVGAAYLDRLLQESKVIGVTWGKTIYSVVAQLSMVVGTSVEAVQLTGCIKTANPSADTRELVRQIAAAYNGNYYYLNAPLYIKNDEIREAFLEEPVIKKTLQKTGKMDIVLTGIGGKSSLPTNNPVMREYITEHDKMCEDYLGSMYGYVLDGNGRIADMDLNKKRIGAGIEDIEKAAHRIVVACGRHKTEILKKAAGNRLYNELLTDTDTALHILEE